MARKVSVALLLCTLFACGKAAAQTQTYVSGSDTLYYTYTPLEEPKKPFLQRVADYFERSNQDRTFEKKMDFTFMGGFSYSESTNFGIGVLASGLYRVDRTDSLTPPSNLSLSGAVSISGFYSVGISGNTLFSSNRHRVDYALNLSSTPRDLWGRGYEDGLHNRAVEYIEKRYSVQARYLYQLLPKTYLGASVEFSYTQGKDFGEGGIDYLKGERTHYTATGVGAILAYDSRDFIPNAYRGVYLSLHPSFLPQVLGNCDADLWEVTFTARGYQPLWRGATLAGELYGEFHSEKTPWPLLARMGGSDRMRGYYFGRYTDNCMVSIQVELRQRIWNRLGAVVWGGAGNVFSAWRAFEWSQTLPNYGVGVRWEFKNRVNIRLDYGFGKETNSFLLSINEAF